jgi:hypothetical protein
MDRIVAAAACGVTLDRVDQWTDKQLAAWAHEHLVYEAQQLRFAAERLAALGGRESRERNMAIESFTIHTRCLWEFLWRKPSEEWPDSVRALHFCADWRIDGMPHALAGVADRINEEIVHLSYGRQLVVKETKGWNFDAIFKAIATRLREFADEAAPERLVDSTRSELKTLATATWESQRPLISAVPTTTTQESVEVELPPGTPRWVEPGTIRFESGEPPQRL